MGFDSIFNLIDILVLGYGVYALYSAYVLQNEGRIIPTFLVFKETNVEDCRDLQGYANFMGPKLWVLGGFMVAYAAVSLVNTYLVEVMSLFWVMFVGFLAVLAWYAMQVKKAMKLFF